MCFGMKNTLKNNRYHTPKHQELTKKEVILKF
jgi:hypothetical protein